MNKSIKKLHELCRRIAAVLFPPCCPACDEVTGSYFEGDLCDGCRMEFSEAYVSLCPRCHSTPDHCTCVPGLAGNASDLSPYTKVMPLIFSGYYTGYSDESIIARVVFKMKRDKSIGSKILFSRIITQAVSRYLTIHRIDPTELTVTFIPRSEKALEEHGFDHMEIIAKHTAEMLGCKYSSLLVREGGESQKELTGADRISNAFSSIRVDCRRGESIRNAKILLLDDVITTGSTMKAAVSRLSLAGAEMIIPAAALVSMTNKHMNNKESRLPQ